MIRYNEGLRAVDELSVDSQSFDMRFLGLRFLRWPLERDRMGHRKGRDRMNSLFLFRLLSAFRGATAFCLPDDAAPPDVIFYVGAHLELEGGEALVEKLSGQPPEAWRINSTLIHPTAK